MDKKVVITGGSGFLGTQLSEKLLNDNHSVVSLDIMPPRNSRVMYVEADLTEGVPQHHYLEKPTYVINLAGEPIFGRWNSAKKESVYHSRVLGTENLVSLFDNPMYRPEAFISASAVGVYGDSGMVNVDERSELGSSFLSRVAIDWEKAAKRAEVLGVRTTIIRNGHIIGYGGMMSKILPFTSVKIVPQPIPGQVCFSWIHIRDMVKIYLEAMEEPTAPSVINAVAPRISTYGEFSRTLASLTKSKVVKIPEPISQFVLGDLYGEMSLSQCVKASTLSGQFKFKYPTIQAALKNIID